MNREGNATMGRITVEVACANFADEVLSRHGALPAEQVRRARVWGVVDTGQAI